MAAIFEESPERGLQNFNFKGGAGSVAVVLFFSTGEGTFFKNLQT